MFRRLIPPVKGAVKCLVVENAAVNVSGSLQILRVRPLDCTPISAAFHGTPALSLLRDMRKTGKVDLSHKKTVVDGETSEFIPNAIQNYAERFPDIHLPTKLFDGIMFRDLPILDVKATPNNTHISLSDKTGVVKLYRSCGAEGFKNARKGTAVAAQSTGLVIGKKMVQRGFKTVRARVQGLGAGRPASLKGVALAGVNIISVTDSTPISWNPPRPRKQRRV